MDLVDEIMKLEYRQWEALRSTDDARAYYTEYFTGDALLATPSGIMDRKTLLHRLPESPVIENYDIRDPQVILLGDRAGVIVYTVTQFRKGMEPFDSAISSIFEWDGSRWRLAYHQMTPIEPE
jgi:hypothetical protein